jgi:hypothetical protein
VVVGETTPLLVQRAREKWGTLDRERVRAIGWSRWLFYWWKNLLPQRAQRSTEVDDIDGAGIGSFDLDRSDGMRTAASDIAGFSDSSELRG